MKLSLGCHLGFWHSWSKWQDTGEVNSMVQHLTTGKEYTKRKYMVQGRVCEHCNANQFRRARV